MNLNEYIREKKKYILIDYNGNPILRPDKKPYQTEAVSPRKAFSQIMYQLQTGRKSVREWDVLNHPDDYSVLEYKEFMCKQELKMDKQAVPSAQENKSDLPPNQGELFDTMRWHHL